MKVDYREKCVIIKVTVQEYFSMIFLISFLIKTKIAKHVSKPVNLLYLFLFTLVLLNICPR